MGEPETIIRADGVGKKYVLAHAAAGRTHTLRDVLTDAARGYGRRLLGKGRSGTDGTSEEFWALKDVSFEVKRGEVVGIIGRNGAGKSTLLKILSRITEPTTGRIEIDGRVASLLEVGTGFHPELTGRENVFLNGAILGMSRAEVRRKFDEIVAFAEVEKFIDTPVKRYSSGMYMRLAFAVAAHLEPEILIVDEVLSVGDASFQKKCLGKISDVAKGGRTVLFVSHNTAAVQALCGLAIYMKQGRVVDIGPVEQTLSRYLESTLPDSLSKHELLKRTDRGGTGLVRLTEAHLEDDSGNTLTEVLSGMDVTFVLGFVAEHPVESAVVDVGLSVHTPDDRTLFVLYSSYTGRLLQASRRSDGQFRCRIPRLPLSAGRYKLGARVVVGGEESDWPYDGVGFFRVAAGDYYRSGNVGCEGAAVLLVDGTWEES